MVVGEKVDDGGRRKSMGWQLEKKSCGQPERMTRTTVEEKVGDDSRKKAKYG